MVRKTALVIPAADWRVAYAFFARASFTEADISEAANHNALLIDLSQLDRELLQAYVTTPEF